MAEEFNIILEHLRALRGDVGEMKQDIHLIRNDMSSLKSHMAGFMTHENVQDEEIAMLKARLSRVEARLSLSD